MPKLRSGSYFPDWLLTPRKRSEQALVAAIADAYLAGVSTRRVDKLVRTLGIEGISKSEVSRLAASLDEIVTAYRSRPLEGAYPLVSLDALVVKVREGGRIAGSPACTPWASARTAAVRTSASSSSPARTAPAGRAFCAALWPAASRASCSSRATPTRASSMPSPPPCRGRLAAVPHALRAQPAHPRAEERPARGGHHGALDLRPA